MDCGVCVAPGEFRVEARPVPDSAPEGWVLVDIAAVGLCGTDYHIFEGKHPYLAYPRVIGHELSGVVARAAARAVLPARRTGVDHRPDTLIPLSSLQTSNNTRRRRRWRSMPGASTCRPGGRHGGCVAREGNVGFNQRAAHYYCMHLACADRPCTTAGLHVTLPARPSGEGRAAAKSVSGSRRSVVAAERYLLLVGLPKADCS